MLNILIIFFIEGDYEKRRWWTAEDIQKKVSEYEATGDSLRQTRDIRSIEKALRYYGKALSTAQEKSLITKMPSLFLKMGDCHKDLALAKSDIFDRMVQARFASRNIGFALRTSITKRGST